MNPNSTFLTTYSFVSLDIRPGIPQEEEGIHGRPRETSDPPDERKFFLPRKGLDPRDQQSPTHQRIAAPQGDHPATVFLNPLTRSFIHALKTLDLRKKEKTQNHCPKQKASIYRFRIAEQKKKKGFDWGGYQATNILLPTFMWYGNVARLIAFKNLIVKP